MLWTVDIFFRTIARDDVDSIPQLFGKPDQHSCFLVGLACRMPPPRRLQAAFNKIPSGGPLLPLLNGALALGAVGYLGYNSVFTGERRGVRALLLAMVKLVWLLSSPTQRIAVKSRRQSAAAAVLGLMSCVAPTAREWIFVTRETRLDLRQDRRTERIDG